MNAIKKPIVSTIKTKPIKYKPVKAGLIPRGNTLDNRNGYN
jgi:hypothetical protein